MTFNRILRKSVALAGVLTATLLGTSAVSASEMTEESGSPEKVEKKMRYLAPNGRYMINVWPPAKVETPRSTTPIGNKDGDRIAPKGRYKIHVWPPRTVDTPESTGPIVKRAGNRLSPNGRYMIRAWPPSRSHSM